MSKIQIISDKNNRSSNIKRSLVKILKRNEINYVGHLYKKYSYVVADLNRLSNSRPAINWLEKNHIYQVGLYGRWKYIWSDEAYLSGYKMAQKISNPI